MITLTNSVRTYAWGSRTWLASLQHRPVPSPVPEAELWMGAHPTAPSLLGNAGRGAALPDVIAQDPVYVLGQPVLDRFGARLPYLLKLLAAEAPLSLQAHPDAGQALAGYAAEETAGLAPDDPARNYVDPSHKPELLVAVEPFDALCGFRDPDTSADILESLAVPTLAPVVRALRTGSVEKRLRGAVELLLGWPQPARAALVAAVSSASSSSAAVRLAARLGRLYPADVGVVVALLLNQVRLAPGEAVFMPAGNLHAYLGGRGVEVMAASDNVLRGGLTPKRVDAAELLRVLHYQVLEEPVVPPVTLAPGLQTWPVPAAEFGLARACTAGVKDAGQLPDRVRFPGGGPRILCCVSGVAHLRTGAEVLEVASGHSAFVTAAEPAVEVTGNGVIVFQAAASI